MSTRADRRRWDADDAAEAQREPRVSTPSAAVYVPPTVFHCVGCRQEKPGRFTKHRFAGGGGWDHGQHLPCWWCFECMPQGQGRGEDVS